MGGDKQNCCEIIQIYQEIFDARHQFKITDRKTAETTKYMLNSFLATKVSFCVQFYELCEKLGISYEELRELFVLDERIDPSHIFVYRDSPYWDSHCFNKDVPAIAESFDLSLLKDVIKFNEYQKDSNTI